ncbi:hypothetical protein ACFQGE_08680 [Halomicroarcula sp. GCM10025817]|uniref:hypothetical protein n=1 Tax=Haloarcula TaxID=2237 RepID=UPI0023E7AD0C|nr:hypothetical protein [Halomicroarcula sp. SYNS111]
MPPVVGLSYWSTGGNPVKQAVLRQLEPWTAVELLDPDTEHPDLVERGYDLYHMAKRRRPSLRDLARAADAGTPTLNPPVGAWLTSDRPLRAAALRAHDVPVPAFAYATAAEVPFDPPVVVKPRWEWVGNAHEFSVVRDGPVAFAGRQFVERYVRYDRVLKVYTLGADRWAVDTSDRYRAATADSRIDALVDRVQSIFGLSVFEVDLAVSGDRLLVLDVNPAVSLRGVDRTDAVAAYVGLVRDSVRARLVAGT